MTCTICLDILPVFPEWKKSKKTIKKSHACTFFIYFDDSVGSGGINGWKIIEYS